MKSATANEPQLRAAIALAMAGAPDEAEAIVRKLRTVRPEDTLLHGAYLPVADAAVQLRRDRPDAAIDALRAAAPYERGMVAALVPAYIRGEARLRRGAAADAIRDFQTVLDNRGADPFSPLIPLSQLGIARALSLEGNTAESRRAYEMVWKTWEHADPDLPILVAARKEYAQLR